MSVWKVLTFSVDGLDNFGGRLNTLLEMEVKMGNMWV